MAAAETKQKLFYLEEIKPTEQNEKGEKEIDLVDFFYFILHKIKFVVLVIAIGASLTFAYSFFLATPIYKATAQLYVVSSKDSVINLSDMQIGSYLANDYQLVFQTWEVNEQVIQNLGLPYSIEALEKMLTVTNPSSTRVLCITISSPDPAQAADIANEYAAVASAYISQTMDTDAPHVLSTAVAPNVPASPNKGLNMLIGSLGSFVISLMILFVLYLRNDRIVTDEDILKYTGVSTLVVIPAFSTRGAKHGPTAKTALTHRQRGKRK